MASSRNTLWYSCSPVSEFENFRLLPSDSGERERANPGSPSWLSLHHLSSTYNNTAKSLDVQHLLPSTQPALVTYRSVACASPFSSPCPLRQPCQSTISTILYLDHHQLPLPPSNSPRYRAKFDV